MSTPDTSPIQARGSLKRLFVVSSVMGFVMLFTIGAISFAVYRTSVETQTDWLVAVVEGRAKLVSSMARFDAANDPSASLDVTLRQLRDAHAGVLGLDGTEFVLGRRGADRGLDFLMTVGTPSLDEASPAGERLGEPMERAVSGQSGTMIGRDYEGTRVLAVYRFIPELDVGLVGKISLAELRAPAVRLGLISSGLGLLLVALGVGLIRHATEPLLDEFERRHAELRETTLQLERSNQDLQQFAYVASHDLQEPLRMVSSFTQLLSQRYSGQLDSDADEFIHFAVDGANRMQKLINGLLEFSRVATRGDAFATVDTGDIVRQAIEDLSAAIEEAGAELIVGDLPVVEADETQLRRVFQNLIHNALKFRGDDRARIEVRGETGGGVCTFSVCDNGIGIPAEAHDRVFLIFQRLHSRDEYEGSGMGLAVCKRIVERHGGRIWIEPAPEGGTCFRFTVPLRAGLAGQAASETGRSGYDEV